VSLVRGSRPGIDGDFSGHGPTCDSGCYLAIVVLTLRGEITSHEVDRIGNVFQVPRDARYLCLTTQLTFGPNLV